MNFQSYYDRGNRFSGFKIEENYFDANLLFIINDQRLQMASTSNLIWPPTKLMDQSLNMDPIKITVELWDEDTGDLLQHIGWTLDVKSQLLAMPIYAPDSEFKTVKMLSIGMLFHILFPTLALISILIHVIRRISSCMTIEVKYSLIIKKFESGSSHLELN
jgi:hypothetical protein